MSQADEEINEKSPFSNLSDAELATEILRASADLKRQERLAAEAELTQAKKGKPPNPRLTQADVMTAIQEGRNLEFRGVGKPGQGTPVWVSASFFWFMENEQNPKFEFRVKPDDRRPEQIRALRLVRIALEGQSRGLTYEERVFLTWLAATFFKP